LVEGIIHTLPTWRHPILAIKMAAAILIVNAWVALFMLTCLDLIIHHSSVLKNKHQAVSQGVRRFGKRSLFSDR
jgi:hypothetical protein